MEYFEEEEEDMDSFDLESPNEDIVLPYQEEDWELAAEPQQSLPYLEPDDNISQHELLEPYTQQQLASFYHNPLLERGDIYTNQFLESSAEYHIEFKHLLLNLQQSIQRVSQLQQECEECNLHIQNLCQKIFDTGSGQVKAEAICQDHRKVTETYRYATCKYNNVVATELKIAILDSQRVGVDDSTLAIYTRILARLQCEQFIFEVASSLKNRTENLNDNKDSLKTRLLVQLCDESLDSVRQCISTLFYFIRKEDSVEGDEFISLALKWTCQLVSLLYDMAKAGGGCQNRLNEEMFILNHIIRSPPGTQSWADRLVQISAPGVDLDFWNSKVSMDHVIYMLFLILRAPKGRAEFLSELKTAFSSSSSRLNSPEGAATWTMIDEDGDDLKGVGSKWHVLPHENDLVALYRQVPFEAILSHIFSLLLKEDGVYCYASDQINSDRFLQVIACCDLMCEVLGEGLATLGAPKYKQLVRRIAQTLRNIVLLLAEHWNNFKENVESNPQRHSFERLQTEYDEFVKRCVERLLCVARLGVYQFLADLPFQSVSQRAAETLYVLMNVPAGSRAEVDQLSRTSYTRQEWLDFIEDPDTKLAFEDQLSGMPENEVVYLLTTFCNLAHARPSSESHLVNIIAMDVYKVSFVYASTRDICSKMGRELLCTVASVHPYIISTVLQYLSNCSDEITNTALYAVSELPFHQWKPTKQDIALLRSWILENPVTSIPVKLVQTSIRGMNWGIAEDGCLFLPHSLHCEMAMLLVEVYYRYEMEKQQSGLLIKSMDQVSRVASVMRSSLTIDESFLAWLWDILLRLKVHRSQLNIAETSDVKDKACPLVDVNEGTLLPQSNKHKIPQSCYVTIMVTSVGHSMNVFLQQGIQLLKTLVESGHKVPAVQCLSCVIPMFIQAGVDLSINSSFIMVLHECIASSEPGILSGIANKLVEQHVADPLHLVLLLGAIGDQITKAEPTVVIVYWMKLVLAMPGWWEDDNAKSLLDFLFKSAFYEGQRCYDECRAILYERHVELMMHTGKNTSTSPKHQNRFLSSVLGLVGGVCPDGVPSFLTKFTADHVYLSYFILDAETRYEDDCKLWMTLLSLMRSSSPESALKKASSQLKLTHTPIPNQLSIYRWAQQFLSMPLEHPLLPLFCQRFFLRYIYIVPDIGSSLGPRFFKPPPAAALFKKVELKLSQLSDATNSLSPEEDFKIRLQKLFMTLHVWIDEEKLHDDNLYLPSLPSHYEPQLLATVRTHNQSMWSKYVDFVKISEELQKTHLKWLNFHKHEIKMFPSHSSSMSMHATSCQRITQLLRQFETPLEIDPTISQGISSAVAVNHLKSLTDFQSVSLEIDQDLKSISQFAQSFSDVKSKLGNLNRNYLELLPDLYSMEEQRVHLNIECQSAFSSSYKCSGPAQVQVRFFEKTLNPVISENLKSNRNSYREEVAVLICPSRSEELCYSALHLTNVVQALIKNTTNPIQTDEVILNVYDAGSKLFYVVADMNSDERWKCPATQHLLTNCLDLLGQIFICGRPDQAVPLLEQMLKKPEIAALLSAHFSPVKACQIMNNGGSLHQSFDTSVFVDMYERVVNAAVTENSQKSSDILFVLITKFDMETWSHDYSPPKQDLARLLGAIIHGLVQHSGQDLESTSAKEKTPLLSRSQTSHLQLSNSAVQEIFTTHLCILIQHSTSVLLYDAVALLLKASNERTLDPIVWEAVIAATFEHNENSSVHESSSEHPSSSALSFNCVDVCIKQLAVYFSEERRKMKSGLYGTWKPYVQSLSRLLYCLCIEYISISTSQQKLDGSNHIAHHETLVNIVFPLFSAWLNPVTDDSTEISWPWESKDQETATFMLGSFSSVLTVICNDRTVDISSCIASLWRFYLKNVMIFYEVFSPSYICSSYQTALSTVPWHKFIPNLTDLDTMIQLCNSKLTCSLHFLCHIIPDIDWRHIVNMCQITNSKDREGQNWSDHTPEVLCRLLHLLFSLGSHKEHFLGYPKLKDLMTSIDDFPWTLIAYEQLDYLSNLVSDRYSAQCLLDSYVVDNRNKRSTDPRYVVLRLLQTIAQVPSTDTHKVHSMQDNGRQKSTEDEEMSWLKRQSYIRCAGRLIRNSAKLQDKDELKAVETITSEFTLRIMRSLMSVITDEESPPNERNLTCVFDELWRYVNVLPNKLQEIVKSKILSFLQELVKSELNNSARKHSINEISPLLTSVLTCVTLSSYNTLTNAKHLASVLESCLDNCVTLLCKVDNENLENTNHISNGSEDIPNNEQCNNGIGLWRNLTKILQKSSKIPQQELIDCCITHGHVTTLYALSQNIFKDDSNDPKSEACKCSVSIVQWISSVTPKPDIEMKLMLLLGQFLNCCEYLMQAAEINSNTDVNMHSVSDILASVLPILEQWSIDRVKVGILGSLGIGRASALSIGFRVSSHCITTYVRQAISHLLPSNPEYLDSANQALASLQKLPIENRMYSSESEHVNEICDFIEQLAKSEKFTGWREVTKMLIYKFFPNCKYFHLIL